MVKLLNNSITENTRRQFLIQALKGRSEVYRLIGNIILALSDIKKGLILAKKIDDRKLVAECYSRMAMAYNSLSKWQESLNFTRKSLSIFKKIRDKKGEAECLRNIGSIYHNHGVYQKALKYYRSSLNIKQKNTGYQNKALNLNNIGIVYRKTGDYKRALKYFAKALKIMERYGDARGQAICLDNIGLINNSLGNYTKALEFFGRALKISERIGDRFSQLIIQNNIGITYDFLGDYHKAYEFYNNLLQISRQIGYKRGEAFGLANIGGINYYFTDLPAALEYHNKALKVLRGIDDLSGIGHSLSSIGKIYLEAFILYSEATVKKLGHRSSFLSRAQKFLFEGEKYWRKLGEKEGIINIYTYLGEISLMMFIKVTKNKSTNETNTKFLSYLKKAKDYTRKAWRFAEEIGFESGRADVLLLLARIEMVEGKRDEAEKKFKQAIKIFVKLKLKFELARAYHYYADALLNKIISTNQKAKAIEYLKKSEEIFEEICSKLWLEKTRHLIEKYS